ncbi:sensor histidine kinase [Nonomuraea sp. LPB2021202275-12-8]|uniref:sensor histidine kinase n=1 Tax=Nonomuraea sp. LPB2021202275-12-8 TaxID=3120159 RepID=UPI00300D40A0
MDPIDRARRHSLRMLSMIAAMMWLFIAMRTVLPYINGLAPNWLRTVPALIAAVWFTMYYRRIVVAVLERRYATREVLVAGALALFAAAVGGGDPMSWGMVLVAWLAVAVLGVPPLTATALSAGTFAVGVMVSLGNFLIEPSTVLVGEHGPARVLLYATIVYAIFCAAFPPSNRIWIWMWQLAVQAQEGKEAHTRLALAEERLRFSRDLHDLVGHQLSAIAVKTELAVRLSDTDAAAAKAEMSEVNTLTRKALRELRQAVRGYREFDLAAELNSVKGVLEAAGVRCQTHLPYRDLPYGVAPVFAYVVREAVTNVLKHSAATYCDILVRFTDEEAEISVRNDGVDGWRGDDLGSGLTGLAERVAVVGGKLTARPAGDGEFLLQAVVCLPIPG